MLRKAIGSYGRIFGRAMGSVVGAFGGVPHERADAVVIGAGVVGIAVARELASKGREVLVVEAASTFGTGISSRNSEVIHAGIYYPPKSLKIIPKGKYWIKSDPDNLSIPRSQVTRFDREAVAFSDLCLWKYRMASLCVEGRQMLYNYCNEREIPHKRIGKLIVATSVAEIPKLQHLLRCGKENGVEDLKTMEGIQAMQIEPELRCIKALLSPNTGIVDTHSLMLSLVGEAEGYGTTFSYNTTVIGGHVEDNSLHLYICESDSLKYDKNESPLSPQLVLTPQLVINSAGLGALPLAKRIHTVNKEILPPAYYARGSYFTLSKTKSPPFSHLIYPIPEDGGLGVHVTLDMNGLVKFGPDVEWIDGLDDISCFNNRFNYSVSSSRSEKFYPEIRKYFPNLKDGSLEPGYSGIRPKLSGPGSPPVDYVIQGEDIHGVLGLVNLLGIESPGLTSSLAIAKYIASKYSQFFFPT